MAMAQAQLGSAVGGTVQVLPTALGAGGLGAGRASGAGSWTATALPALSRSPASGPLPALGPAPDAYGRAPDPYNPDPVGPDAYAQVPDAYAQVPDAYGDLGFTPLGAPPYGNDAQSGLRGLPCDPRSSPRPALACEAPDRRYEPGYDGPPRFEGAPRGHGGVPQDELSSYPYGPQGHGPQAVSPYPEDYPDRGAANGWVRCPPRRAP